MNKIRPPLPYLLFAIALLFGVGPVQAQQTGFAYEGRLTDAGAPATGLYDFQFSLWDGLAGGNQVGGAITVAPQGVTNGLFTVNLNFGAGIFNGAARWMELRVRTNGSASAYVVLSPRQPINPVPYALFSMNASAGAISASDITSGTLGDDRLSSNIAKLNALQTFVSLNTFSGVTVAMNTNNRIAGTFSGTLNGNGAGVSNVVVAASNVTGVLAAAKLPANVAYKDTDIAAVNNSIVGVSNSVVALGGSLGTVSNSLNTLNGGVLSLSNSVNASLSTLGNSLAGVSNSAASVATALTTVSNTVGSVRTALTTVSNSVGTVGGAVLSVSNSVLALSNSSMAQLIATNAALVARISDLENRLTTVSNYVNDSVPSGSVVMSADAVDAILTAKGYVHFSVIDAPVWRNGTADGLPSPRSRPTAVWTGNEMVIWGGLLGGGFSSGSGGRYSAGADLWTAIPTFSAPSPRYSHTAIWTGTEMIIWGGFAAGGATNSGGRFSTSQQQWTDVTTNGAPSARADHSAAWTGTRMIVWGGRASGYFSNGGIYNPATDSWVAIAAGGPNSRFGATAVWTGSRFVIWGGENDSGPMNSGGRLPINANGTAAIWLNTSTTNAPDARTHHTAIWTGTRMIVWGGQQIDTFLNTGASYDPVADTWTALPTQDAPSPRANHVAVWTGSEMLIFSGADASGELATGGAYDPVANKWRSLDGRGAAVARQNAAGVWSGGELIIFGGEANGQAVGALQRLNPQPAWHLYRKP